MPRITARLHHQQGDLIVVKPDHEPHSWSIDFRQAAELIPQLQAILAEHMAPQPEESGR